MGRKAGVSAEETRAQLLAAATAVFAAKGYDGASIADITREAGLSSGAIYAHFSSKAELFTAVLEAQGEDQLRSIVGTNPIRDIGAFFQAVGSSFDRQAAADGDLAISAISAAKRDPEVAKRVAEWLARDEGATTDLIVASQDAGQLDPTLSAAAVGRFTTMLTLGALLTRELDLPAVDHAAWSELIGRLVAAARPHPEAGSSA